MRATEQQAELELPSGWSPTEARLILQLAVSDPEVLAELRRWPEGEERERFALQALRLGVLSLKMASGQLDAGSIREAGQQLIGELRELLTQRSTELTGTLGSTLEHYFDPQSGILQERIRGLVQKDGELERLLRGHLAGEESVLSRTLVQHLGEASPIWKMLSPTEASGLKVQLEKILEGALSEQRQKVLREFSLDDKGSALSRMVSELSDKQGELTSDLKGQIAGLVKEFSRDNESSALSRMTKLLENTSQQIGRNLTLDDEQSALARLKRELQVTLDELARKNTEFHTEVRSTLSALEARRAEAALSTRHGIEFEAQVGELAAFEAQRVGDIFETVGTRTGTIKNCKVGDHVTTLGPESPAPGSRIVWEAKDDRGYDLKKALAESEEARKNRGAQIGVFIYSRRTAPTGLESFARYGSDLVAVWDPEDNASDLYVRAAFSVARALCSRLRKESASAEEAWGEIDRATRAVEKQLGYLEDIRKWGESTRQTGENIRDRANKMKSDLAKEIDRLDSQLEALKTET